MTNRDYYQDIQHMSMFDMEMEFGKYCRKYGANACSACKLHQKMNADPNSSGESCFTYWLKLEISKTPRGQELVPSSMSSEPEPEPEPKPPLVNNETSFTMLDE